MMRYSARHPERLVLCAAVIVCCMMILPAAASAAAPDYSYWVVHAQTKVYTTTGAPASAKRASGPATDTATMALSGALAEFEGRQVVIRAKDRDLRDVWLEPSELVATDASGNVSTIAASNVSVYKVHYVRVSRPSYGYSRTGLEPDPLLPMTLANGEKLGWRPGKAPDLALRGIGRYRSRPFYVLFRIPKDAVPGLYRGTVKVTCTDLYGEPAPDVTIPVSLTVYPFSVERRSTKTAFGFATGAPKRNTASGTWLPMDPDPGPSATRVPETTSYHGDQVGGWLRYLSEHRVSPYYMTSAWNSRKADGTMDARDDVLDDYLGTGPATTFPGDRFAFNTMRLPTDSMTAWLKNPFASSSYRAAATRYYRSVASELGTDVSKSFVYPFDEPRERDMPKVRRYAAFIDQVMPGAKFLLTTDTGTQHGKLVPRVDIYVYRLHFAFRDYRYLSKIRGAHKGLWVYTAKTKWQKYVPGYLLDKPLADSRVEGWFVWKTRAGGLLYYGLNHYDGNDPYVSQLDTMWAADGVRRYANGDAMLIYPGYYPKLGLVVEGAPPVGSLRMEAIRDGLEDYEYIRLVKIKYGTSTADRYVARIIGPVPPRTYGKLRFPKYKKTASYYEATKKAMAARLSP